MRIKVKAMEAGMQQSKSVTCDCQDYEGTPESSSWRGPSIIMVCEVTLRRWLNLWASQWRYTDGCLPKLAREPWWSISQAHTPSSKNRWAQVTTTSCASWAHQGSDVPVSKRFGFPPCKTALSIKTWGQRTFSWQVRGLSNWLTLVYKPIATGRLLYLWLLQSTVYM